MDGYCNMCGKCCEAIRIVDITEDDFKNDIEADPRSDWGFARDHWHEIEPEEAFRINPLLRVQLDMVDIEAAARYHYFTCDVFDAVRRRCGDHDNRPDVCRSYPVYSHPDEAYDGLPYSLTCGYNTNMPGGLRQVWEAVYEEMMARRNVR